MAEIHFTTVSVFVVCHVFTITVGCSGKSHQLSSLAVVFWKAGS